MRAQIGQTVGYVAPPTKPGGPTTLKRGVVTEAFDDGTSNIDLTERTEDGKPAREGESLGHHTALGAPHDAERKREGSWHFLNQAELGSAAPAAKKAPAGATA
jgi:hypothetical protein